MDVSARLGSFPRDDTIAMTAHEGGTGLGMSIVHSLVSLHGGSADQN